MGGAFNNLDCRTARAMLSTEMQRKSMLYQQQRQAVAGDAVGVFLIGVPASSLMGMDVAGELSASKGKIVALEARTAACR